MDITLGFLLTLGSLVWAQAPNGQPSAAGDEAAILQPYISETTILVIQVDTPQLNLPDLTGREETLPREVLEAHRSLMPQVEEALKWLRDTTGNQPFYVAVGIPLSKSQWPVFALVKRSSDVTVEWIQQRLGASKPMQCAERDGYIVATPINDLDVVRQLESSEPTPRAELADALAACQEFPIQVALLPPDYVRRAIREMVPQLPAQLGGGSSDVVLSGVRWATLGIDPSRLHARLVIQSESDAAATNLVNRIPQMLQSAYEGWSNVEKTRLHSPITMLADPGSSSTSQGNNGSATAQSTPAGPTTLPVQLEISPAAITSLISSLQPQVSGSRITMNFDGVAWLGGNFQLLVKASQVIKQVEQNRNGQRFKQILLAMHNHYDVYKMLPPAKKYYDVEGQTKLSWRVHLLPFLEQNDLFQQFHLDEAWDSPHNKTLLEKMPDVYRADFLGGVDLAQVKPGYTTFLAPVGDDTIMGGTKPTTFSAITDGTSNTIVLVEVKPELAVPWTAPDDYALDPKNPGSGLQVAPNGKFLAGLADGSTLAIPLTLKPDDLLHLFQKSDGNPVDWRDVSK